MAFSARRSDPCWSRPPSVHPACGSHRRGRGPAPDRRRRPRKCPGGLRSGRRHWRRRAASSLRRSAAGRFPVSAPESEPAAPLGIEPVVSFGGAAEWRREPGPGCRYRRRPRREASRRRRPGSASFAAGSACAFSTRSMRSLSLVDCAVPAFFNAASSASSLVTWSSSAARFCTPAVTRSHRCCRNGKARHRQCAANGTRYRRQRDHCRQRRDPSLAQQACVRRLSASGVRSVKIVSRRARRRS